MNGEDVLRAGDRLTGVKSLSGSYGVFVSAGVIADAGDERHEQRITIGIRARHGFGADNPAAARAIVHHELLPSSSLNRGAMMRAIASVPPPGAVATIMRTGRAGYDCAVSEAPGRK